MENKFDISQYNDRYFKWHLDHTRNYALQTMDWFIKQFKPNSVIDYGCGIGAYLESAINNRITQVKGFDIGGEFVKTYTNELVRPYIEYIDCTLPTRTHVYECVISLETAEHIETSKSDQFVQNIVNSAAQNGIILFSAAQPGQAGTGHINCQPKSFWIEKFSKYSWICNNDQTKFITENWSKLNAPDYIINNLIVFNIS